MSDKISASIVTILFLLSKDNIKNLDLCMIFQIEILDLCRFRLDFFLDLCSTKPIVAFKVEKTLGRQTALIRVAGATRFELTTTFMKSSTAIIDKL